MLKLPPWMLLGDGSVWEAAGKVKCGLDQLFVFGGAQCETVTLFTNATT